MNFFELCSRGVSGFFPRYGEKFVAFAEKRLLDALRVFGEVEAEAALDAEKVVVNARQVTVVGAKNFVVSNAEGGFAAVRTVSTDR